MLNRRKFLASGAALVITPSLMMNAPAVFGNAVKYRRFTVPLDDCRLDVCIDVERLLSFCPVEMSQQDKTRWLDKCMQDTATSLSKLQPGDIFIHPDYLTVKRL